jgi:hypothetical protein
MIHIEIHGTHMPLKKDGGDEKAKKLWKRTDPLYLLRMALANKLRSKHWRYAHHAKKKWMDSAKTNSKVSGTPVKGPAIVVVEYALPGGCDIDAPVKVLLDAYQEVLFESGDDKDIESLTLRRHKTERKKLEPQVHIYAYSKESEIDEARRRSSESFDSVYPYQPIPECAQQPYRGSQGP